MIERIKQDYRLNWEGTHGINHWHRVFAFGRTLANHVECDVEVLHLFAYLHDAQRFDEWTDPAHGLRGAAYAQRLADEGIITVTPDQLRVLKHAITHHNSGFTSDADPTVQVCWDADRLDLPRVGIKVDPKRLCTDAAREYLLSI